MSEWTLQGPVTGGRRGHPFGAAAFDLAARGYVEQEWFLSGDATRYRHAAGTTRSFDGSWTAEPVEGRSFRTRLLVRRPERAEDFNGTVVAFWTNVSNGFEILTGESRELYRGYAFVGILAQRVAITGYPTGPNQGLAAWDPERYADLAIPSDDYGYDIFTQGLRAVGPRRPAGASDPMGGLDVRRVIAFGASQSAGRLATYLNAIHQLAGAADGYLFDVYFGNGSPLETPAGAHATQHVDEIPALLAKHGLPPGGHLLRTPDDAKVFVLNSETESLCHHPVRQPDSGRYRMWELAGHAHGTVPARKGLASSWERDLGLTRHPMAPEHGGNPLTLEPGRSSALRRLHEWLATGAEPPVTEPLAINGDPPAIRRDADGNALGGLRLPDFAVPCGRSTGFAADGTLDLFGSGTPFTADVLRERYGDAVAYRAAVQAVAQSCVDAGTLLPEDAPGVVEAAVARFTT